MGSLFSTSCKSTTNSETITSSAEQNPKLTTVDPEFLALREKWQKEQEELKKNVILVDTEPWAKKSLTTAAGSGDDPDNTHDHSDDVNNVPDPDSDADKLRYIGGVDISFVKGDDVNACAAYVVLEYPSLELVYKELRLIQLTAPYIPGFLAFREVPPLMEMIEQQRTARPDLRPDLIMVDGNGILHPRKFGLACHLGVLLDIPCLGVAKTLFQVDGLQKNAEHKERCARLEKAGDTFPLVGASGDTLGVALRSRDNSPNPIFVSPGHRVSLATAADLVASCCKFRIPEPTRQADVLSREFLRINFKPENEEEDKTRPLSVS